MTTGCMHDLISWGCMTYAATCTVQSSQWSLPRWLASFSSTSYIVSEDEMGNHDLESMSDSDNPPVLKRLKTSNCKFKRSWTLPQHISSSSKGDTFAYCRLCSSHFSVAHGGFNDVKRHVSGTVHQQRLNDLRGMSAIGTFFQKDSTDHQRNVISAEVRMANFIAMHNLSFQSADHLSDLLPTMFPDSKIASDFGCKHTKTKAICCDALDLRSWLLRWPN